MAKTVKPAMFVINIQEEEAKCTESQLDILLKIHDGQYRLVKKKKRSSVWNVYREIARPDGTKLKWRYYCLGCKRVMQSTGGTTSNLRIHKCHVRYLKQHGNDEDASSPQHSRNSSQTMSTTTSKKQTQQYDDFYETKTVPYSEEEEEYEENDLMPTSNSEMEQIETLETTVTTNRPLLKLFSENEEWSPEIAEEQAIEIDPITEDYSQDFSKETISPKSAHTPHIDASALSEAESYARAWAHAFLKLSEDQKFYAKRSIDELLVLGRLERLNISTVTSLTTNL